MKHKPHYLLWILSGLSFGLACSSATSDSADSGSADSGRASSGGMGAGTGGASLVGGAAAGGSGAAGDSSAPSDLAECPAYQEGNDFLVCRAGYVSSEQDPDSGGVSILPNGQILVGGSLAAPLLSEESLEFLSGGVAGVSLLSASGKQVLGGARLGQRVSDVASGGPDGRVAVVGDFGLAVLDSGLKSLLFASALGGEGTRVSVGEDGTVAAAAQASAHVFSPAGQELGSFGLGANREEPDLVVDSLHSQIIATGYNQRDGGGCTQLQVPFIKAFDYEGKVLWTNYDWTHAEAAAVEECADSRGYDVSIGGDGKLYYVGESHGGNSVHRRMPRDLSTFAPNVEGDAYQAGYNMNGAAPMGYVGRFDLETGEIEAGSVFVVRLSDTKGNAFRPRAVGATADGTVLLAGASACCIENAEQRMVGGVPAMPSGTYAGGGFLMVLSPDLQTRRTWTTFNGSTGGGAQGVRVAVGSENAAVLIRHTDEEGALGPEKALILQDSWVGSPAGASDDYLAVFRLPK